MRSMQPTSSAQFDATEKALRTPASGPDSGAGGGAGASDAGAPPLPPLEEVRDGIWALPQAMPNAQLPYTLSYLVLDANGDVHVIDPGWDSDVNFTALERAVHELGSSIARVATASITHLHRDHTGLAGRLQAAAQTRVVLSRIDQNTLDTQAQVPLPLFDDSTFAAWGVPVDRSAALRDSFMPDSGLVEVHADTLLDDGELLDIPGRRIRVLATPGHTAGSLCFTDPDARLIFTGDHLLPMIFPGIGLGGETPGNPVSAYVDSLDRLAPFDEWEVLPGHGYRFTGMAERRAQSAEHHNRRTREAADVLSEHPDATAWQVASQLHWTAGWEALQGPYLRSALAQTAMHIDRVRSGDWAAHLAASVAA